VKQTVLISYALAVCFGILGVAMVFVRTRYAIAIYMVVFGSIIVAAYKMGMIHERPLGGPSGTLDDASPDSFSTEVNAGSVMEFPDSPSVESMAEPEAVGPAR
jgi:hypothetical protein